MRVFFAGEVSIQQSLNMLQTYRDKCLESKETLKAAHAASCEYGTTLSDDKKSKFWNLSILYGESFYNASIDWANKAIAIIEEGTE